MSIEIIVGVLIGAALFQLLRVLLSVTQLWHRDVSAKDAERVQQEHDHADGDDDEDDLFERRRHGDVSDHEPRNETDDGKRDD